ncbi:Glycogen Phosphorylase, Muscle Form [Manis pentadactyla]|nr:Glycogen Phosphorylase, Muscle Form [Manis pentadactyla]
MARMSFRIMGPKLSARFRILCSPLFSETLALRKELGTVSDVKRRKMVNQVYGEALLMSIVKIMLWTGIRFDFGSYSDVRRKRIDLHLHAVASLTSMLMLRVQFKGPGLLCWFSVRKSQSEDMVMDSHEHHEELSSGSDVMGIARWWIRAIVRKSYAYDTVTERIGSILM